MNNVPHIIEFVRARVTELRLQKNVSEHRMSLDLGKSGAYVRSITSGLAAPSLKELGNIIEYFGMTPADFFAPTADDGSPYARVCERLRGLSAEELEKVEIFLGLIGK